MLLELGNSFQFAKFHNEITYPWKSSLKSTHSIFLVLSPDHSTHALFYFFLSLINSFISSIFPLLTSHISHLIPTSTRLPFSPKQNLNFPIFVFSFLTSQIVEIETNLPTKILSESFKRIFRNSLLFFFFCILWLPLLISLFFGTPLYLVCKSFYSLK